MSTSHDRYNAVNPAAILLQFREGHATNIPTLYRALGLEWPRPIPRRTPRASRTSPSDRIESIRRIIVAAAARPKIRQELRDCGVTESVIYPDLDGIGREIRQIWEDRRAAAEGNS
jgi:hypothetical protein